MIVQKDVKGKIEVPVHPQVPLPGPQREPQFAFLLYSFRNGLCYRVIIGVQAKCQETVEDGTSHQLHQRKPSWVTGCLHWAAKETRMEGMA